MKADVFLDEQPQSADAFLDEQEPQSPKPVVAPIGTIGPSTLSPAQKLRISPIGRFLLGPTEIERQGMVGETPAEQRGVLELGETLLGATVSGGYGHIRCSRDQTKTIRANRASWILHFGPIPHGHDVLHKCDFPRCVNPNHLFTGTAKDNALDAAKKGRMARGESSGTSKLNSEMIFEIRELYASGKHSQVEIASAFRCGQMTISDIIRRKTWSHI